GRKSVPKIFRRRGLAADRAVVRARRHVKDFRDSSGGGSNRRNEEDPGAAGEERSDFLGWKTEPGMDCVGRRVPAGRAARASPHRPFGGTGLCCRRAQTGGAFARGDAPPPPSLQLIAAPHFIVSSEWWEVSAFMKFITYKKYTPGELDALDMQ